MRMVYVAVGVVLLFLCGFLGVAALARGTDSHRASETARTFAAAFDRGDTDACQGTLTRAARERLSEWGALSRDRHHDGHHGATKEFRVGTPLINGDQATVTVTEITPDGEGGNRSPQQATVRMRREDGAWRVYAMTLPLEAGLSPVTLDFEHPEAIVSELMRATGEATGRAMGAFARGMEQGMKAFQQGFEQGMRGGAGAGGTVSFPTAEPVR